MDSGILAQLHLTSSLGTSLIPKLPGLEASAIFLDVSSKGQVYPGLLSSYFQLLCHSQICPNPFQTHFCFL